MLFNESLIKLNTLFNIVVRKVKGCTANPDIPDTIF